MRIQIPMKAQIAVAPFCAEYYRHTHSSFFPKSLNCFVFTLLSIISRGSEDGYEADKNKNHFTQSLLFWRAWQRQCKLLR